jgi:sigma54-dependent transcription regulator
LKILISFIGNHDPFADRKEQLGPILSILKRRSFDKLYLLFNNERYWDSLIQTQSYCNQHYPNMKVDYRQAESLNPIDYNLVYPAMYQVIQNIKSSNPEAKFTISVTSGTPTMHACWLFLVKGKAINAKIIQTSREAGIQEITFKLDDFPKIEQTDEIKAKMAQLNRENDLLKKSMNFENSIKTGFYIPENGFNIDKEIIPAYYKGALKLADGNATIAAKLLGLKPHTFRKRLRSLK